MSCATCSVMRCRLISSLPRRAAGAQDAVDERRESVRFVDDHARVRLLLGVRQLSLEQLRRAAQSAERILHFVRELANDAARQPLLRDERGFAAHAAVALRVEQLEHERSARCRAAPRGSRARFRDRRRAPRTRAG